MKHFRNIFFILLIASSFVVTGCGKKDVLPGEITAMLNDSTGKVVRLGVYGDPLELNPVAHTNSEHGAMVGNFVHASPLRKLADGSFEPYLFDSYYLSRGENGTVILEAVWKKGLKWHDGTEFDPRDLEFTISAMKNPDLQSPYADLAAGVLSVSSFGQGQRTRILFARDSRQYLDLLCVGLLPAHLLKNAQPGEAAKDIAVTTPSGVSPASYTWAWFAQNPTGLGPYCIKSRQSGSFVLLEPYKDFFDGSVASRPLVLVRSSYDYQQLINDFRSGRYDWINLPSMLAEQLETMKLEGVKFVKYPNPAFMLWLFNNRRPFLNDVRVRKALDLLVDRQQIRNQFSGDGEPLFVNPLASSSEPVAEHAIRVEMAGKLLDEANIKDLNNDGIREVDGKAFEIGILLNDDNLVRRVIAEKMLTDLRQAGIVARIDAVSWADFVSTRLRKAEYDTALVSYQLPSAGNWVSFLHSAPVVLDNLNFAGVADTALDKDLEALDSMFYDESTVAARERVGAYLENQKPVAFLFKPFDVGLYPGTPGTAKASCSIWNDVLNWKLLFGPADSSL